jgi:hypothetical protein
MDVTVPYPVTFGVGKSFFKCPKKKLKAFLDYQNLRDPDKKPYSA